jgi:hypothetical protein
MHKNVEISSKFLYNVVVESPTCKLFSISKNDIKKKIPKEV